eukprot:6208870-Pleurochrysis_carterae.AAC.3
MGYITGVVDDRGKFIFISRDELEARPRIRFRAFCTHLRGNLCSQVGAARSATCVSWVVRELRSRSWVLCSSA